LLEPDVDPLPSDRAAFVDKIRQLMTKRVHLNEERQLDLLVQSQVNQPVEDFFPVLVSGKIIVGNKEAIQSLGHVLADQPLDIIRRPPPRLPSLHIYDRAERTLEWAAASRIEARYRARRARRANCRNKGQRLAFDVRQVRH